MAAADGEGGRRDSGGASRRPPDGTAAPGESPELVLLRTAREVGCLPEGPVLVPELLGACSRVSGEAAAVFEAYLRDGGRAHQELLRRCVTILFAKGVEIVVAAALSPGSEAGVAFEPDDVLEGAPSTSLSGEHRWLVLESVGLGDRVGLRWAAWLMGEEAVVRSPERLLEALRQAFWWAVVLGVTCAVDRGYHEPLVLAARASRHRGYHESRAAAAAGEEAGLARLEPVLAAETDPALACLMGVQYWTEGLHRMALAAYERALELGGDAAVVLNKAVCLADMGEREAAAATLREYVAMAASAEAEAALAWMRESGRGAVVEEALGEGRG